MVSAYFSRLNTYSLAIPMPCSPNWCVHVIVPLSLWLHVGDPEHRAGAGETWKEIRNRVWEESGYRHYCRPYMGMRRWLQIPEWASVPAWL